MAHGADVQRRPVQNFIATTSWGVLELVGHARGATPRDLPTFGQIERGTVDQSFVYRSIHLSAINEFLSGPGTLQTRYRHVKIHRCFFNYGASITIIIGVSGQINRCILSASRGFSIVRITLHNLHVQIQIQGAAA